MANFQPSRKQRHGDALLHQVDHSVRRSSVSSICAGIQHSGGARMVAPKLLIPSTEIQEVTMSTSATKRSMSQAAAVAAVLFGLLSPTGAEVPQHNDLTSHSWRQSAIGSPPSPTCRAHNSSLRGSVTRSRSMQSSTAS